MQLPPAFCLPQEAQLSAALEAAYEREFDQLPYVSAQNHRLIPTLLLPLGLTWPGRLLIRCVWVLTRRVLNERRRPVGYLDVKAIKSKFEKGEAGPEDPLSAFGSSPLVDVRR
jgi:hypothetical protein